MRSNPICMLIFISKNLSSLIFFKSLYTIYCTYKVFYYIVPSTSCKLRTPAFIRLTCHWRNTMRFFSEQKKVLESLGLYSDEIEYILEKLMSRKAWILYDAHADNTIKIQVFKLEKGKYFALVNCESLCGIKDKALFIKQGVEFALKQKNLPVSFNDIAVGGLVSDEGRLGFLSKIMGQIPPPAHEYVTFKLPGEANVSIEDPRTGIFDTTEKFQSRTDDQVCCFAASTLLFASYTMLKQGKAPKSTPELFSEIYRNKDLKAIIQQLENKVGHSTQTKQQVIDSFIVTLSKLLREGVDKTEEVYQDLVKTL